MFRLTTFTFIVLLMSLPAIAGGRGGHNTTFDPNNFPGGTVTTINCNGATDSAALASFVSAGVAANPALQVLRLIGPACNFQSNNALLWDGTTGGPAIQNSVVWGYGVKLTGGVYIGADGIYQDNTHDAKIQTVSAGASTVTLVTAAQNTRFAVGDWVLVAGLELQNAGATHGGYPPNWQFFEYRNITAINAGAGIITLNESLTNSYLSTWPVTFAGDSSYPQTGPASIYLMPPGWNLRTKIFGLETPNSFEYQTSLSGREIVTTDIIWNGHSPAPTQNQNVWFFFGNLAALAQAEIDKNIDSMYFYRTNGNQLFTQSAGVNRFVIDSSNIVSVTGTGVATTITNSTISALAMGPAFFGHGVSIAANNSTITTAGPSNQFVDKSIFSFSSGTFSIANGSAQTARQWGIPGMKYDFIFYDGTIHFCNTPFTITAVTQDGTNTNFVTDIAGALPSPTCGGSTYNKYLAYPAATVTQKYTGPANLTQYAAP